MNMSWPALILAPLLALAEQSVAYALATPGCAHQHDVSLNAVPLAFLLLTLAATAMAWVDANRHAGEGHSDADRAGNQRHFMARAATGVGALSSLAILAMWVPLWWLPPCIA
jgi:hypothetical protein